MGKTRRKSFRKKRGKTKRKYSKVNRRYKRHTLNGRRPKAGSPKNPPLTPDQQKKKEEAQKRAWRLQAAADQYAGDYPHVPGLEKNFWPGGP